MSLFKLLYQSSKLQNAKKKSKITIFSEHYPTSSVDTQNNLFYIQHYGHMEVHYPFSLTVNPLDTYLLLYTIHGQGQLCYLGDIYSLTENSALFIHCKSGFHIEIQNSCTWEYQKFYLNGSHINFLFQQFIHNNSPVHQLIPSSTIKNYIKKLSNYIVVEEFNSLVCSSLIDMILTNLIIERDSSNLAFIIPSYILQIRNLFDKEYYNSFNLDDLSTKFHVSKYTLSKEFQSFFHIPPIEYLIQKRINIAKTLLMNTNFTINEVAARVGIYNTTHFINLFKKRVGVTPLQYRKNINKELNLLDLD